MWFSMNRKVHYNCVLTEAKRCTRNYEGRMTGYIKEVTCKRCIQDYAERAAVRVAKALA